jgi:hypothetical protein
MGNFPVCLLHAFETAWARFADADWHCRMRPAYQLFLQLLRLGMTIQAIKYARRPSPSRKIERNHKSLTIVGSIPKYSPIPPHTPPIFLLVSDKNKFLFMTTHSSIFF